VPAGRSERQERAVGAVAGDDGRRGRDVDAKLNTLCDYRLARGLCIRCGEKWSHDHHCPEQIQLHVLQEVWDLCHGDDCDDQAVPEDPDTDAQLFMTLSSAAVSDRAFASTMQFLGAV